MIKKCPTSICVPGNSLLQSHLPRVTHVRLMNDLGVYLRQGQMQTLQNPLLCLINDE